MAGEFPEIKKKLTEHLRRLEEELSKIRGGRANPALLEDIVVDLYESKQPIKALGSISVRDSQTIVIEPWDENSLEPIAKSITKSQNGLQAVVDGERVRVPFPPLSQERREEFIRFAAQKTEEMRIQLRRLRDNELKELKNQEDISKDDFFRAKKKIDELFKEYSSKIDKLKENKEKELASI